MITVTGKGKQASPKSERKGKKKEKKKKVTKVDE